MNIHDWLQFGLFVGILLAITRPMGNYLVCVLTPGKKTWLDPMFRPVEKFVYKLLRIDPTKEQNWTQYALSLLIFSAFTLFVTYTILRLQGILPLNPQHFTGLTPHLAFNTAVSFTTNTNWQSYVPEATMSYFSQMVGLTLHNFVSAAVGIAVAAVLIRAIANASISNLGNFWVDLLRIHLYLLLPLALVMALFLISQGMIQNFLAYTSAVGPDGIGQTIAQGPMASQVSIKMIGTNGGGFMNANAAHPFENPNPLSNFIQMLSIFLIPSGLTYYLGKMVKNQKHGWAVWSAMCILFCAGVYISWNAETHITPVMSELGVTPSSGNMEGKEVRFGIFNSALFATITTDASCGAVNAMHDSFTPVGGLVPMFNMHLGEIIFGGVGAGMYGMLVFIILTVFIAGLMIGRTPEYLGKKITAFEVKMAVVAILVPIFSILALTALAAVSPWGTGALNNSGPHGLSEILYAYTSATANNGSAFAGLSANVPWWNTTLGIAMLLGRFLIIIPVLALAGSLTQKKIVQTNAGSFPVSGPIFTSLLIAIIVIVGGLTFLPSLTLGPIIEHFLMFSGKLF